jgi:hypothetical protein
VSAPELELDLATHKFEWTKHNTTTAGRKPHRWDHVDLTVVGGAGHVGIPLVLCFADSGLRV